MMSPSSDSKPRVLLVEDDLPSAQALRQLLRLRGCEVVLAGTRAEAVRAVEGDFDAAIIDLMLPDGDGTEVVRLLRDQGRSTRIAITTAVSDADQLHRVKALAPDLVLSKPIDLRALLRGLQLVH
jgi:two-component system response regulator CpxR